MVDGTTYSNIAAAYGSSTTGCLKTSNAFLTCEIWDYNLAAREDMPVTPWQITGGEIPVHLRLGPGYLTVHGPLIVPRGSTIEGAGRAIGTAPSTGTVIQAGSNFGGVGYITWTGATGCNANQHGTVTFTSPPTTAASFNWSVDSSGNFGIKMVSPGAGYGTTVPGVSASVAGCTLTLTLTAHLSNSVVIIGDTNTGTASGATTVTGATEGARLVNLTVDCNSMPNCTGIELQNAQELSGPMFVNVVNYSNRCLWVHGQNVAVGTDNSFAFQIECNGYYSAGANGTAGATMTFATVPVEFDNTISRGIVGATVNPTNASTAISLTGISSCTNGTNTFTATGTPAASLPSNWNTTPPYGLSAYATLAGYTGANFGWNKTWPITVNFSSSFTINGVGSCPSASASGGTATLEPSADVIVCSGTGCAAGAENPAQNNPTQVSLTQLHTEHAGTGFFVTGANTSAEILAPTVTVGNGSMYAGVTIDSAKKPASGMFGVELRE